MDERDARSLSAEAKEALRVRAVLAVVEGGMTQQQSADAFGVKRPTVGRWVSAYRRGGEKALAARRLGRPPGGGRLLGWQAAWLKRAVIDKCPDQLRLPGLLWTRELVRELILRKFDISVSVATVGRYLRRWGLTVQKPSRQATEQDPEAVRQWMEHDYPRLRARARREGAEIHFSDEVGVKSTHHTGTTWGERGRTPVVRRRGKRYKINVIKSVAVSGQMRFMTYKGRFTAAVFIKYMDRLIRSVDRKVFLVVDNHSSHGTKKVKSWVAERSDRIELVYLPTYSPELNPAELSNNDLKGSIGRSLHENLNELVSLVTRHLRRRQRQPTIITGYITKIYPT